MKPKFKPLACLVAVMSPLLLTACQSESDVLISADQISVPVPSDLRQVRALRAGDLSLQVSVNDQIEREVRVDTLDENQNVRISIPAEQNNEIKIEWFANVDNRKILLADFVDIVSAGQTELQVLSYISTGDRFDTDGDGRSNLSEAIENRNLLSEFEVEVPFLTEFGGVASTILDDGIDNGLSGDPIEEERDTTFRLRHDGNDLVVYVCGQDTILRGDSGTSGDRNTPHWNDDTIFIYLDGADSATSANTSYDGIDDFQLMFPRAFPNEVLVAKGTNNQFCPNGDCIDQSNDFYFSFSAGCAYEFQVRLPLAELNMSTGTAIGFDIEITDDDNGGQRDGSRGWIGFDDHSDLNTHTFGTIRLN